MYLYFFSIFLWPTVIKVDVWYLPDEKCHGKPDHQGSICKDVHMFISKVTLEWRQTYVVHDQSSLYATNSIFFPDLTWNSFQQDEDSYYTDWKYVRDNLTSNFCYDVTQ